MRILANSQSAPPTHADSDVLFSVNIIRVGLALNKTAEEVMADVTLDDFLGILGVWEYDATEQKKAMEQSSKQSRKPRRPRTMGGD